MNFNCREGETLSTPAGLDKNSDDAPDKVADKVADKDDDKDDGKVTDKDAAKGGPSTAKLRIAKP